MLVFGKCLRACLNFYRQNLITPKRRLKHVQFTKQMITLSRQLFTYHLPLFVFYCASLDIMSLTIVFIHVEHANMSIYVAIKPNHTQSVRKLSNVKFKYIL